ncbi:unnamed protein product [Leptidea sinapis]|uniref:15-hydroxyprostaglandin dehydrogenase n=1 Tax=Leptidea sinapis TaxID=189913 RepID=A0A5E4Q6J6_9NEOP|nr:unnamed protein product [Leptidea sinapis]
MYETKDITCVVTGGAQGIGLAIVENLLLNGAKHVIILDYNEEEGNKVVKELQNKYSGDCVFIRCDITRDLDSVYSELIKKYKHIDVFVNNAGISDTDNPRRTMNVNAVSLIEWTFKVYEDMRIDKGGKGGTIINIASILGYENTPILPTYQASKHAVIGFTKSLGHEVNYNQTGVRVVAICPGMTTTNLERNSNEKRSDTLTRMLLEKLITQEPDNVGKGTLDVYKNAESGTFWLVEQSQPPLKVNLEVKFGSSDCK